MANQTRGEDSCGYYYNGNIHKGAYEDKKFINFISKKKIEPGNLDCELFIGHTRKATQGTYSVENAHPYEYNDYIQVHNGHINNIKYLTNKYKIYKRYNVDSQGLSFLIYQQGWDILEEYIGRAALAMTWRGEPEKLYLFHGKSQISLKNKHEEEERPLFILKQPEGIYFSSIKESLTIISSDGTLPEILPYNVVCEIKNGEFIGEVATIDRSFEKYLKEEIKKNEKQKQTELLLPVSTMESLNLPKEKFSLRKKNQVDVYLGRYYVNNKLMDGEYRISNEGYILETIKDTLNELYDIYYFVKGVMMKDFKNYKNARFITQEKNLTEDNNIAFFLSPYSKYPVCSLLEEGKLVKSVYKNKWYENNKILMAEHILSPKYSNKIYYIKNGITCNIRDVVRQTT